MDAELSSPADDRPDNPIKAPADDPIEDAKRSVSASTPSVASNRAQSSGECPHCAAEMPPSAGFCPGCGWSMRPIPGADRAAAALAYLTLVAGGVVLVLPEFRQSRFVRFHAWQSVLLWGVFFVLTIVVLLLSNVAAAMALLLFGILASLAMLFLWMVLTVKAWQGERFELPLFGDLAARMK